MTSSATVADLPDLLRQWNPSIPEARRLQERLKALIRTDLEPARIQRVAGVDVAYESSSRTSFAAVVILTFPELQFVESATARTRTTFPYVPGLLSFRECPPILRAFGKIRKAPDLVYVDGHGYAHPRRFGLACHLGLCLELPTIGIGKSRLCGEFAQPANERGSRCELLDAGERIGMAVRTREDVKPVFVSVGLGIPLEACVELTLKACRRYRIPEPIRQADRLTRILESRLQERSAVRELE